MENYDDDIFHRFERLERDVSIAELEMSLPLLVRPLLRGWR